MSYNKKQNILDEDSYSLQIGNIIERDFFPDTELLAVENAYLEAESQNDYETMKNLTVRRRQLEAKTPRTQRGDKTTDRGFIPSTPGENPGETPKKEGEDDGINPEEDWDFNSEDPERNPTVTLNGFLKKNTSEDNFNYHKVLRDLDQKKHLAKYRWVYELDNKHRKYVPYATCDSGLGIAAKQKLKEEAESRLLEEKQAMLALGYVEEEIDEKEEDAKEETQEEKEKKQLILAQKNAQPQTKRADASLYKRSDDPNASKILNNWRYMSKNNVMFYREAIGSKYDDGKFKKPQQIVFENTRFKEKDPYAKQMERMRIEKASKAASVFKAGHIQKDGSVINQDGTTAATSSLSSTGRDVTPGGRTPATISKGFTTIPMMASDGTPLRTPILTPHQSAMAGALTVGATSSGGTDRGFVPNTPVMTPGRGPDESPMMTWGQLGGTPVALTPESRPPALTYSVPSITKREAVAEKLAEKIKSRERQKKTNNVGRLKKTIFGQTPDRLGSMLTNSQRAGFSPAARRLVNSGAISGIRTNLSARSGRQGTPLVRAKKRSVNDTPTPSGGGGGAAGGMLAAKLKKMQQSGNTPVTAKLF